MKTHFLVIRDCLTNRLITHKYFYPVCLVWAGRALGQCFQLDECEDFCLWKPCSQIEPFDGRERGVYCWGNVDWSNVQQEELWCIFTRLFIDLEIACRHFLCILISVWTLSSGEPEAAKKDVLVHFSLVGKQRKWSFKWSQTFNFQRWLQINISLIKIFWDSPWMKGDVFLYGLALKM